MAGSGRSNGSRASRVSRASRSSRSGSVKRAARSPSRRGSRSTGPKKHPRLPVGCIVRWSFGEETRYGKIKDVHTSHVSIKMADGREMSRNATEFKPAYEVVDQEGMTRLKGANQLSKSTKKIDIPM